MNLIVCCTPFQMLIAERIIEKYHDDKFYALVLISVENEKNIYYRDRLFSKVSECKCIIEPTENKFSILFYWLKMRVFGFCFNDINRVFISNINSRAIQLLLSSIKFNSLYTFDDGTANIVKSSSLYDEYRVSGLNRLASFILSNKYSTSNLKNISIKHFTVYRNRSNIIENKEFIRLFSINNARGKASEGDKISILLGQPIYELYDEFSGRDKDVKNIEFLETIIRKFGIKYYYPHPRERYVLGSVEYIYSKMVFEDYFSKELCDKDCIIYTFFSGAVLSIIDLDNVEVVSLKPKDFPTRLIDNYRLMKEFGIPIIEV